MATFIATTILGLTGTAATIAAGIINLGVAYGISRAVSGGPSIDALQDPGVATRVPANPENRVPVVYGRARVKGTVFYGDISDDNQSLALLVGISEGPINLIGDIHWDGYRLVFDSSGNVIDAIDEDGMSNDFLNGNVQIVTNATGGRSAEMEAFSTRWAAGAENRTMPDMAYAFIRVNYNREEGVTGITNSLTFDVQGRLVRTFDADGNLGTTPTYSTNPAECLLDYMTNTRYGPGNVTTDISLNIPSFAAHAAFCGTLLPHIDTSGNEVFTERYTCNGVVNTRDNADDIIGDFLACSSAILAYAQGEFFLNTDTVGTSVMSFDDDNIYGGVVINEEGFDIAINELEVEYISEAENHQADQVFISAPQARRNQNEPELNDRLILQFTNNNIEAERLGTILLNKSRNSQTITFSTDERALRLQPNDIISVTRDQAGIADKLYRVLTVSETQIPGGANGFSISAQEYAASDYDDLTLTERDPAPNTTLPTPRSLPAVTDLTIGTPRPGAAVPNFDLQWTVPTTGIFEEYRIFYNPNNSVFDSSATIFLRAVSPPGGVSNFVSGSIVTEMISGLPAGTYNLWVVGRNGFARSPESNLASITWEPQVEVGVRAIRHHDNPVGMQPMNPAGQEGTDNGWYDPVVGSPITTNVPTDPDPHWEATGFGIDVGGTNREVSFDLTGQGAIVTTTETPQTAEYNLAVSGTPGERVVVTPARPEITNFGFSGTTSATTTTAGLPEIWTITASGSSDEGAASISVSEEFFIHMAGTTGDQPVQPEVYDLELMGNANNFVGVPEEYTGTVTGTTEGTAGVAGVFHVVTQGTTGSAFTQNDFFNDNIVSNTSFSVGQSLFLFANAPTAPWSNISRLTFQFHLESSVGVSDNNNTPDDLDLEVHSVQDTVDYLRAGFLGNGGSGDVTPRIAVDGTNRASIFISDIFVSGTGIGFHLVLGDDVVLNPFTDSIGVEYQTGSTSTDLSTYTDAWYSDEGSDVIIMNLFSDFSAETVLTLSRNLSTDEMVRDDLFSKMSIDSGLLSRYNITSSNADVLPTGSHFYHGARNDLDVSYDGSDFSGLGVYAFTDGTTSDQGRSGVIPLPSTRPETGSIVVQYSAQTSEFFNEELQLAFPGRTGTDVSSYDRRLLVTTANFNASYLIDEFYGGTDSRLQYFFLSDGRDFNAAEQRLVDGIPTTGLRPHIVTVTENNLALQAVPSIRFERPQEDVLATRLNIRVVSLDNSVDNLATEIDIATPGARDTRDGLFIESTSQGISETISLPAGLSDSNDIRDAVVTAFRANAVLNARFTIDNNGTVLNITPIDALDYDLSIGNRSGGGRNLTENITRTTNRVPPRLTQVSIVEAAEGINETFTLTDGTTGSEALRDDLVTMINNTGEIPNHWTVESVDEGGRFFIRLTADDFLDRTITVTFNNGDGSLSGSTFTRTQDNIPQPIPSTVTIQIPTESINESFELTSGLTGTDLRDHLQTLISSNTNITNEFTVASAVADADTTGVTAGEPIITLTANDTTDHSIAFSFTNGGGDLTGSSAGSHVDGSFTDATVPTTIRITYDSNLSPQTQDIILGGAADGDAISNVIQPIVNGHGGLMATVADNVVTITTEANRPYAQPTITTVTAGTSATPPSFVIATAQDGVAPVTSVGTPSSYSVTLAGTEVIASTELPLNSSAATVANLIQIALNNLATHSAGRSGTTVTATSSTNSEDDLVVIIDPGLNDSGPAPSIAVSRSVTQTGIPADIFGGTDGTITIVLGTTNLVTLNVGGMTTNEIATIIFQRFFDDPTYNASLVGNTINLLGPMTGPLAAPAVQVVAGQNSDGTAGTLAVARSTINTGDPLVNTSGTLSSYMISIGGTIVASGNFEEASSAVAAATTLRDAFSATTLYSAALVGSSVVATSTFLDTAPDVDIIIDQGTASGGNPAPTLGSVKRIVQEGAAPTVDYTGTVWTIRVINQEVRVDDDTTMMGSNNEIEIRRGIIEDVQTWDDISGVVGPNGENADNGIAYLRESFTTSDRSTQVVFTSNMLGSGTVVTTGTIVRLSYVLDFRVDGETTWTEGLESFRLALTGAVNGFTGMLPVSFSNTATMLLPSTTYWIRVRRVFTLNSGTRTVIPTTANLDNFLVNSLAIEELIPST